MGKEEDGDLLMKQAKAHHTKTLTKWSSDWDQAATCYERAAQTYTFLKNDVKARDAWEQASMAHEKAKNPFLAAKAIESLANFLKDNDSYAKSEQGAKEISVLYVRASRMYALDQKPERQAEALAKAARLAPPSEAANASKLILQALDALEDTGKAHLTLDLYRSVILMQVRGNLIAEAITTLKREMKTFETLNQPAGAAKAGLEIVVLCLAIGDWVLADREFRAMQPGVAFGFPHSKEQSCAYGLLSAMEERDEGMLKDAMRDSTLQFIIPEIGRLAKKLTLNSSNAPAKRAAAAAAAAAGGGGGGRKGSQKMEDEEDDLR